MYLTYKGLLKLLTTTRKYVPVKFTEWLCKLLGEQFTHVKFISAETDTINSIQKSIFSDSICQYSVDKYRIDLYFPEYNLAIECDEFNHKYRNLDYEIKRENYIKDKLKFSFIRYNPNSYEFDIFEIIKKINIFIKLKDEYEKDMIRKEMKIQDLENTVKYKELELKCKDMEIELLKNKLLQ